MPPEPFAKPIELVAVINSYNRLALLREGLEALASTLARAPELAGAIVVYEAGSSDGSRQFLEDWRSSHPETRLEIVTPEPGAANSFSDGVNDGCAAALRHFPSTRFLLLYETDNWIAGPGPILQARELLATQPDLAAVGWTVKAHDGGPRSFSMAFPSVLGLAAGGNLVMRLRLDFIPKGIPTDRTPDGAEWWRVDVAFTSPILIRREAWEGTGGLDAEVFPFAGCDLDWAWRCRKAGLGHMAIVSAEGVVHDNRGQESGWSEGRVLKQNQAQVRLLKRHRGRWRVNAVKPLLFLRHALESVALLPGKLRRQPGAAAKLGLRLKLLRSVWRGYEEG